MPQEIIRILWPGKLPVEHGSYPFLYAVEKFALGYCASSKGSGASTPRNGFIRLRGHDL